MVGTHGGSIMVLRRLVASVVVLLAVAACQTVGGQGRPRQFDTSVEKVNLTPASKIMLVYVGANNCPYCRDWESVKDGVVTRLQAKGVEYRESISPSFADTSSPYYWPDDIKWITTENAAFVKGGTPRFLVLVDGKIVRNKRGISGASEGYIDQLLAARASRPAG